MPPFLESKAASWFAVWADIPSGLLLALLLLSGGVTPKSLIWGRSFLQNLLFYTALVASILFTVARVVLEGLWREPGPREFMVISIIYTVRWILLRARMTIPGTQQEKLLRVARAMRELRTVRRGPSTHRDRKGVNEIVVRRGVKAVGRSAELYWRGVEEEAVKLPGDEWRVRLKEARMYSPELDAWGTVDYFDDGLNRDDIIGKIFSLVRAAVGPGTVSDFSEFFKKYDGLEARQTNFRTGREDVSDIAKIARKIAADGMYFVSFPQADFRTREQVSALNQCIENFALDPS